MISFDEATQAILYRALKSSFPEAKVRPTDLVAFALGLQESIASGDSQIPDELKQINLAPYAAELDALKRQIGPIVPQVTPRKASDTRDYYWVKATHTRLTPNGFEPFTGEIAMARVALPRVVPADIDTQIGSIDMSDHLIDTVLEANQKYARFLGYELARVDCITPPREGVRFGAISVMLGYKKETDPLPSCYILEAGTATGQPKVLYLGKHIGDTINAYSGYQPTPFACPSHAYTGQLTLDGNHPKTLTITSRQIEGGQSLKPYIEIQAEFERQTGSISSIWPGFLIARAATIVLFRKLSGKIPEDCEVRVPGAIT